MKSKKEKYPGLSEANKHIEALAKLELPFLSEEKLNSFRKDVFNLKVDLCFFNEDVEFEEAEKKARREKAREEAKKKYAPLAAICKKEGHVGKWVQKSHEKYVLMDVQGNWVYGWKTFPYWTMKCERCGRAITTSNMPIEFQKQQLQAQIDALNEKK
jgi:hypothetical protein